MRRAGLRDEADALRKVQDPDLHQDIVALGFVKDLKVCGGNVAFQIELTTPACPVKDLMRSRAEQETVSWSAYPRWVRRMRNVGDAMVEGVELEAKFRADQVFENLAPVELRANLALLRSRVADVPGPDNRLDDQAKATANIGADYRFRGTPWTVGGSLGLTPGYRTQLTEFQSQELGLRRVLDAYVLWQIDAGTRLRLSLANLVPIDSVGTVSVLQGSQLQTVNTVGRTDLNATLRLEMKL